jgi:surfactin synthase thioesterase subunit
VLTVRGSLEFGDLLTDLHAKPIEVHLPACDDRPCHVHEGMLRAAAFVHCNTADALEEASGRFPDWPLFVTGHSLGGGVAALVAVLLRQQGGAPERLQVTPLRL